MRYDAILIGAGMSSLAAALRLAMYDRRVLVLERHAVWGGLNSFYTLGGRPFDVGLHALTNWAPKAQKGALLTHLLRQLRIKHDELRLGEQSHSEILFPDCRLRFDNDTATLEEEVARHFPDQIDGFRRLSAEVAAYSLKETDVPDTTARALLPEYLSDPALREMVLCPILYYGSAMEDDVAWHQFLVLFRSIFLEGLARPEGGIRPVINLLIKRLKRAGAELRTNAGVKRVLVENGSARGVELDDGTVLEAETVFSSAGWVETMGLCGREVPRAEVGRLTFVESVSVLDRTPLELGHGATTSFFSTTPELNYRQPDELVDVRSGVISAPNNFASEEPLPEGILRLTFLANYERWCALDEETYLAEKERAADAAAESAALYGPDWRPHTVFRDVFTPRTITKFTGHVGGCVYGSPTKRLDGTTGVENLFLVGTDQGYLGVIGSMISGVSMANRHSLAPA